MKKNEITIREIQEWEKHFTEKKGISKDEEKAIKIAVCKLMEETGEVTKAILEDNWDEVPAEVVDTIVFACKLANIAEEFHGSEDLSKVFREKIEYCEERKYDKDKNKLNKPKHKKFI